MLYTWQEDQIKNYVEANQVKVRSISRLGWEAEEVRPRQTEETYQAGTYPSTNLFVSLRFPISRSAWLNGKADKVYDTSPLSRVHVL